MNLFRTSLLSGLSTVIRLLCGLVINKFVAVIGGPAGFALVSQLQNAFALASTLSSGAMGNGISIITARHEKNPEQQKKFFATAFFATAAASLPISIIGLIFSTKISLYLLHDSRYYYVIIAASLTVPLFAFGSMLASIVTGKQDVTAIVAINILSSLLTLILAVLLAWFYRLPGALVATATYQAALLLVAILWLWRAPWLNLQDFIQKPRLSYAKDLLRFVTMAGISGICINLAQFAVRNHIISQSGIESAGIWDTVNRISILNWTIMSAILSVYLIPKLASLEEDHDFKLKILNTMAYIIPAFSIVCILISLFSGKIISILFTKEFSEAADLLPIQLLGDVARVFTWFYSYKLIIKQNILHYAFIEISSNTVFVLVTVIGANTWGDFSPVIANAVAFGLLAMYCAIKIRSMGR